MRDINFYFNKINTHKEELGGFEVNKVYCIDCLLGLKKLPDNCIDLVVTSPPYNCREDYDSWNDNMKWGDYLTWCHSWITELYRILKDDGRLCLNVLVEMGINDNKDRVSPLVEFYNILSKVGLKVRGLPMWTDIHRVKYTSWGSWMNASAPYIYIPYEVVIIAYKKDWKKRNEGESTIKKRDFIMGTSGVWNVKTETKQLTKANFSVDLAKLCINLLSYKNDLVFDPFAGSGTTLVASKILKRKFLGFEISQNYCSIADKRIKKIRSEDILVKDKNEGLFKYMNFK